MKTEDLVNLLARQPEPVPAHGAEHRYAVAMLAGLLGSAVLMLAVLGLNPALREHTSLPMFWAKGTFAASLAIAGVFGVLRLSRPGAPLGAIPAALATSLALMWALAAWTLLSADPAQRPALVFGRTWTSCPFNIALLSLPVFIGMLWATRGLAPTRLRLAGAAAGLAAGAAGALVYTLHCPELTAPFLGIWYVLGMLIPTFIGALIGSRLLRW